jgi:hypothetical protein
MTSEITANAIGGGTVRDKSKICHHLRQVDELVLWMVISDTDRVYGPFASVQEAHEIAEGEGGSFFECRARLISAKEM